MRDERDHYYILQVDPRAEHEVIEAAYRRLAAKYHPDLNPSPEAHNRMKLINAAYEVLSSPEKRRAYDHHRGHFPDQPWSAPPVARRIAYPRWLLAVTLGIAAVAFLSRSPMFIMLLLVLLFGSFMYWWLGRSA